MSGGTESAPLVLSHGVIENAEAWSAVVPHLEPGFAVTVHEARGRGHAPLSAEPFEYADLAEDVEAFADRLGLGRFFHAGHSMGGRIALEHALAHPDRVLAIAVISARAEAPDAAGRERLAALAGRAREQGSECAIDMWTRPGDAHYERVREISSRNPPEGTAAALEAIVRAVSLLDRLPELRVPVLVVAGDHDPAYVRSAELMVERIPDSELRIVSGAGHFPNLEAPAELAALLRTFFLERST